MIIKSNTISTHYVNIYSLQPKKIGIPIFQRFYAWKKQQVVQLENDLLEMVANKSKQLYFLDFIFYEEDGIIKLADGQQRIVTINNLIKAIKDVAFEQELTIDKIDLFDIGYDIISNDQKYKTHFYNYATAPFKNTYMELKNYVEENVSIINELVNIIKNNIFIYMKECTNADDAFVIFQQINTGGKPLSKDEVIKTALDQYSTMYGTKIDTSKIKEVRQSLISFYKYINDDSNKTFDNMEIISFLKDYVTKDKSTFQDFVDSVHLFNVTQKNPIRYVIDYIKRPTLYDVLNILSIKKIDIWSSKDYVTNLLIPLCMMSITLSLNGGSPTTYRYLLNDVIKMIKNDNKVDNIRDYLINFVNNDKVTWKIKMDDFVEKLGNNDSSLTNIKKALLILDVIDKNVSGTINVDKINLEHIYPQNPNYEWAMNGWPSNREEQKQLINNIGNYILLCEKVNKSIQNQYITCKIEKYNSIIVKDKVLQTELNTADFKKFEDERENYIYERQKEMAKMIQSSLPFGKILIIN